MIRAIHFSDLHIGVERYGQLDPVTGLSSRLGDFLRALDTLVDYALADSIDLVIFAGDAYKTRDPSPTHQREFAKRLLRLSQAGIHVFLLVGNHDLPQGINKATAVDIFDTLAVPNITVGNRIHCYRVQTRGGPVQIVAVPWVTRSAVLSREEYRNLPMEEVNRLIEERVSGYLDEAVGGLDPAVPVVLTGHLSVADARYGSERSVMIGQDVVFLHSTIARPQFCYVALGHIHRHQALGGWPPVVYSGSLERIDFSEEKEDKGFVVVEIPDDPEEMATYRFQPIAARPFLTIDVDADVPDPTAEVLDSIAGHDLAGKVVRVIIRTAESREGLLQLGEIRRALKDAFFVAGIYRDVRRRQRARLGTAAPEDLAPADALAAWLRTKEFPAERAALILDRGRRLIEADQGVG